MFSSDSCSRRRRLVRRNDSGVRAADQRGVDSLEHTTMHENIVRVEKHHSETSAEQDGRCILLILHAREGELSVRQGSSNWVGSICLDVVHFTTVQEIRRDVDRDPAFELSAPVI